MSTESGKVEDGFAGVFGRGAATFDRIGYFSHFGERLVRHAQLAEGSCVLDVAIGRGALTFPAAKQVGSRGRVIGTDIASEMLQETAKDVQSGNWTNIELRQMDAEQIQFPDCTFDYVLCGFALWFFPHPHRALQEFYRVLKPKGRLALTTWRYDSPMHNLQRDILRAHVIPPPNGSGTQQLQRYETSELLESTLGQAGFVDTKVIAEDFEAVVPELNPFWEQMWSGGFRKALESMPESAHEAFRESVYQKLEALRQADGIHAVYRALFALASK